MQKGIERRKNIQVILRLGIPGIWLICLPFIAGFLWIFHEKAYISIQYLKISLLIGLSIPCISFALSFFAPKQAKSVIVSHLLAGLMISGLLVLSLFFGLAYYFIEIQRPVIRGLLLGTILFSAVLWCWYLISDLKQRITERRFIEKEFSI